MSAPRSRARERKRDGLSDDHGRGQKDTWSGHTDGSRSCCAPANDGGTEWGRGTAGRLRCSGMTYTLMEIWLRFSRSWERPSRMESTCGTHITGGEFLRTIC